MSPEAQRIAIAKACPRIANDGDDEGDEWIWRDDAGVWNNCYLNDPLVDLNAMHAAEEAVLTTHELREAYESALMWSEVPGALYPKWRATASQRAEAFLRTLNLWSE